MSAPRSVIHRTRCSTRRGTWSTIRVLLPRSGRGISSPGSTITASTATPASRRTGCSTRRCTAHCTATSATRRSPPASSPTATIISSSTAAAKGGSAISCSIPHGTAPDWTRTRRKRTTWSAPFATSSRGLTRGWPRCRLPTISSPISTVPATPTRSRRPAEGRAALAHYLCNATPTRFDPLAAFSEEFYLARYPDVAAAVAAGRLRNGYRHFLADGARELRAPHPAIDLAWYASAHPQVRAELDAGLAPDAFTHYLRVGRMQGLAATPPVDGPATELAGRSVFRARADNLLPLWGRSPLDFTMSEPPALSVIMVLHGQFALSMMALASLRANYAGPIELILIDSGSDRRDAAHHPLRARCAAAALRQQHRLRPRLQRRAVQRHLALGAVPQQRRGTRPRCDRGGAASTDGRTRASARSAAR